MRTRWLWILSASLCLWGTGLAQADPVHNGTQDYATIQAAVNAANPGDMITVDAGTYTETVDITKSLTIRGAGVDQSILQRTGQNGFQVRASDVTLQGFTISGASSGVIFLGAPTPYQNVTLDHLKLLNATSRGVEVNNNATVDGLTVRDCLFENPAKVGFRISSSGVLKNAAFTGCAFTNNFIGIYNSNDGGTSYLDHITVSNCTFTGNTRAGFYAEEITDSAITNCVFVDNLVAIQFYKAYTGAGRDVRNVSMTDLTITNSTNVGNRGIIVDNYQVMDGIAITGCSITGPEAGFMFRGTAPTNSTFDGNTVRNCPKGWYFRGTGNVQARQSVLGTDCAFYAFQESDTAVDLTGVTFVDAAGAATTQTHQQIEAKVQHKVDDALLGLVTWDTAAPDTSFTATPDALIRIRTATFTFTGTDDFTPPANLQFSWQLDGGAWSAFSTTATANLTGLAEGSHTFAVKAQDEAGNIDATPATCTFEVDVTRPTVQVLTPTAGAILPSPVTVTWTGSDNRTPTNALTYSWRLDAGSWHAWATTTSATYTPLADGPHTFEIRSRDEATIVSTIIAHTFTVDNTAPETAFTATPAAHVKVRDVTVTFTGSDAITPPANLRFSWQLDGGAWSTFDPATTVDLTALAEGSHTFAVKAQDEAGNVDATPATCTFEVDVTRPTVQVLTPANGAILPLPVTITWTGADNLTPVDQLKYSWRLYSGTWSAWSAWAPNTSVTYTNLTAGAYSFQVRARDLAGTASAAILRTFTVDIAAPDTEIIAGPAEGSFVTVLPVTLEWTGSDDVAAANQLTFQWRIDGGAWNGPSADTLAVLDTLADGPHTFDVAAIDQLGRVDPTPATRTFIVDLTPPDSAFVPPFVNGLVLTQMPTTFVATGTDLVTPTNQLQYAWKLDNGAWSAWGTAATLKKHITKLGAHTLQVKTRDLAGWVDLTPAVLTYTIVDTQAPETTLVTKPGAMAPAPVTITWTGSDNITPRGQLVYSWRLNGGTWSDWATTTTVSLTDMLDTYQYTFEVRAKDLAGLIDPTPARVVFRSDSTAPDTTITWGPTEGALTNRPVTFSWTGNDNLNATSSLKYSFRLDGGTWSKWVTGTSKSYNTFTPGLHTFEVRAKDLAGNIDQSPAVRTFIPDTTAPQTTLTGGPAQGARVQQPVVITWTASDNLTPDYNMVYSWKIDTGAWSPWNQVNYAPFTTLAPGKHTFRVRARDVSNNIDTTPASRVFTVNDSPPETTITLGPAAGATVPAPVKFTWKGTDDQTPVGQLQFSWRVSGGPWSAFSTAKTVTLSTFLWDGTQTFEVRARDASGNVDPTPASRAFSVDSAAPDTFISWAPYQTPAGVPTAVYWTGLDNLTGSAALNIRWRLDGGVWSAWSMTGGTYITVTAGSHLFEVQAADAAGNVDPTPASQTIVGY